MKYIDLTHTFTGTMPVYPGDPVPELKQIAVIDQDGFTDHSLTTAMHVGTHLDAPLHMIKDGDRITDLNIDRFFGHGVLVDARGRKTIDIDLLDSLDIKTGDMLLVLTAHSARFHQADYYQGYPLLTEAFAQRCIELGIGLVGLDTPSPDEPPFTIHKLLLGNNVLIIENLNQLDQLLEVKSFDLIALPPKLATDAAPVRVVALAS